MELLTQERYQSILSIINDKNAVTVAELAQLLDTSESTIRRDLTALDELGKIKKVFGGATSITQSGGMYEDNVHTRENLMYDEKTEIPVYNEAKIIGNGDPVTFMRSLTACSMLHGQFGLLKMLQYIAIGLGVVVVAVLSFMGSIAAIGPVHIAVYGAFWCLVTLIIPKIYKAVPKR